MEFESVRRVAKYPGPCVPRGVSMTAGLWKAIRARARQEDRPMSWVIQKAIERYLVETESEAVARSQ